MKRVFLNAIFISLTILAACNKKQPPVNPEVPVNLFKVNEKHVL